MKTIIVTAALSLLACAARAQETPKAHEHHGETVKKAAQPAFLGIRMAVENGNVAVLFVQPDSPAAKAGLKQGDIILRVAGEAVEADINRVVDAVNKKVAGEALEVRYLRGDKEETVRVELSARPGEGGKPDGILREAVEASEKALRQANDQSRQLRQEIREMKDKVESQLHAGKGSPNGFPLEAPPTAPGQMQKLAPEIPKDPFDGHPGEHRLELEFRPAPGHAELDDIDPFHSLPRKPEMLEKPRLPKLPDAPNAGEPPVFKRTFPAPRFRSLEREGRELALRTVKQADEAIEEATWNRAHKAIRDALEKSEAAPSLKESILRSFLEARHAARKEHQKRAQMEKEAARMEKESEALKARAAKLREELKKAAE